MDDDDRIPVLPRRRQSEEEELPTSSLHSGNYDHSPPNRSNRRLATVAPPAETTGRPLSESRRHGLVARSAERSSSGTLQGRGSGHSSYTAPTRNWSAVSSSAGDGEWESVTRVPSSSVPSTAIPGTAIARSGSGTVSAKMASETRRQYGGAGGSGFLGLTKKDSAASSQRFADISKSIETEEQEMTSSSFLVAGAATATAAAADRRSGSSGSKGNAASGSSQGRSATARSSLLLVSGEDESMAKQKLDAQGGGHQRHQPARIPANTNAKEGSVPSSLRQTDEKLRGQMQQQQQQQPRQEAIKTGNGMVAAAAQDPDLIDLSERANRALPGAQRLGGNMRSSFSNNDHAEYASASFHQRSSIVGDGMTDEKNEASSHLRDSNHSTAESGTPIVAELAEDEDEDIRDTVREEMQRAYQFMLKGVAPGAALQHAQQIDQSPQATFDTTTVTSAGAATATTAATATATINDDDNSNAAAIMNAQTSAVAVVLDQSNRSANLNEIASQGGNDQTNSGQDNDNNDSGSNPKSKQSRRCFIAVAAILLVIVVVGVVVAVVLSQGNGGSSSSNVGDGVALTPTQSPVQTSPPPTSLAPVNPPTDSPTENQYRNVILDIISPRLIGAPTFIPFSELTDRNSVAFQVLEWMSMDVYTIESMLLADANGGDGNLSVGTEWNTDKQRLLERFSLVYMYNVMNGGGWIDRFDFVTSMDVCDWNNGIGVVGGVYCDEQSRLVTDLSIRSNRLTGEIPQVIFHLEKLAMLDISDNDIVGSISSNIGRLTQLRELVISLTKMDGSLPTEMGSLVNMEALQLSNSDFSGPIPSEMGNWVKMFRFDIERSSISGTLPEELSAWTQLQKVDMRTTDVTGNLDPVFCTGALDFSGQNAYLRADCIGGDVGEFPPAVSCSCCTRCCINDTEDCVKPVDQPDSCNNSCVACTMNFYASDCGSCPTVNGGNGEPVLVCSRSCEQNTSAGTCESRTTFDEN